MSGCTEQPYVAIGDHATGPMGMTARVCGVINHPA